MNTWFDLASCSIRRWWIRKVMQYYYQSDMKLPQKTTKKDYKTKRMITLKFSLTCKNENNHNGSKIKNDGKSRERIFLSAYL